MSQKGSYSWYVVGSRAAVTKTRTNPGLNEVEAYLSPGTGLGHGPRLLWRFCVVILFQSLLSLRCRPLPFGPRCRPIASAF